MHSTLALFLLLLGLAHSAPIQVDESNEKSLIYITLEEHLDASSVLSYQKENAVYDLYVEAYPPSEKKALKATLANLSVRIPDMNENRIRMQVIGQDPQPYVLSKPEVVHKVNKEIAKEISKYPDRFRAYCYLPMAYPAEAAGELKHCISDLGFVGALVDNHLLNNTFYDGPEYDALFDVFERLDVPLYLHPTYPQLAQVNGSEGLYSPDKGTYPDPVAAAIGTAGWGWHSDTGLAFLRMWFSGVFDRHPNLRVGMGHDGDIVPYMLHRIDYVLGAAKTNGSSVLETYAKHIWVTTSGFFSLVPFRTLLAATSIDHIMYSVDYPWGLNANGTKFMDELKASGLVSKKEWEQIAYRNAEKFFKLG